MKRAIKGTWDPWAEREILDYPVILASWDNEYAAIRLITDYNMCSAHMS